MATERVHKRYNAKIDDAGHIYDGDTIEDVLFKLPGVQPIPNAPLGEIYPDTFLHADGVWMRISVRLAGIDCPERHPRHFLPDGTPRPAKEIAHEATLAWKARQVVVDMLAAAGLQFELRNVELGKFASRIVGSVFVFDTDAGKTINLSEKLLDLKLARPYTGGTKQRWTLADGPAVQAKDKI